jgi:hypothetical protein
MKRALPILIATLALLAVSCSLGLDEDAQAAAGEAELNDVLALAGTPEGIAAARAFDAKWGTELAAAMPAPQADSRLGGGSDYLKLTDIPFNVDGAVYLSGGGESLVSQVIDWMSPKNFPGSYYHGAVLDLNKFDPANLTAPSLQSAVSKGAGYESAADWQANVNVCVLKPNFTVNAAALNSAQAWEDQWCSLPEDKQEYGFFKGYVNIFNVVTKEDRYWWYCTKVVWDMWNRYGIDIDSNDPRVDFTTSNLYGIAKTYYTVRYFWSSSKAKEELNKYIADAKKKIVFAEEILCSPYLTKVYERIRKN